MESAIKVSISGAGLLIAGLGGGALSIVAIQSKQAEALTNASTLLGGVAATVLGFLVTAVTILAALANLRFISNLYKTGHAKSLLRELLGCAILFMVVMVVSVIGVVGPESWAWIATELASTYFSIGVMALAVAGVHFYKVMLALGSA